MRTGLQNIQNNPTRDPELTTSSNMDISFDKLVGLDSHWGNLFPKILLLVVAVGLLVFYILSHIKKLEKEEQ